jgi:hypothetical protein
MSRNMFESEGKAILAHWQNAEYKSAKHAPRVQKSSARLVQALAPGLACAAFEPRLPWLTPPLTAPKASPSNVLRCSETRSRTPALPLTGCAFPQASIVSWHKSLSQKLNRRNLFLIYAICISQINIGQSGYALGDGKSRASKFMLAEGGIGAAPCPCRYGSSLWRVQSQNSLGGFCKP